jgi:RNA-binding protein
MPLTNKQKQSLKARAHALKPVILIGHHGLTAAVQLEIDRALNDHELIKVRVADEDRLARHQILEEISHGLHAELIQVVGRIGTFYRKNQ